MGHWQGTVDKLEESWGKEMVSQARPEFEALIGQLRARIARWANVGGNSIAVPDDMIEGIDQPSTFLNRLAD